MINFKITPNTPYFILDQPTIQPGPGRPERENRRMKQLLSQCAIAMYSFAGLGIAIRGRKATRTEAPVLVVSPHSSFLDAVIIYLTGLTSPLVRNADANLGSKCAYVCNWMPNGSCSFAGCFIVGHPLVLLKSFVFPIRHYFVKIPSWRW